MSQNSRRVALRKESVDRNFYYSNKDADWVRSLSARRAWIEIVVTVSAQLVNGVALRKESVDRNITLPVLFVKNVLSLSARRAWIEIDTLTDDVSTGGSLSARRAWIEMLWQFGRAFWPGRRSPQGERG